MPRNVRWCMSHEFDVHRHHCLPSTDSHPCHSTLAIAITRLLRIAAFVRRTFSPGLRKLTMVATRHGQNLPHCYTHGPGRLNFNFNGHALKHFNCTSAELICTHNHSHSLQNFHLCAFADVRSVQHGSSWLAEGLAQTCYSLSTDDFADACYAWSHPTRCWSGIKNAVMQLLLSDARELDGCRRALKPRWSLNVCADRCRADSCHRFALLAVQELQSAGPCAVPFAVVAVVVYR